MIVSINQPAYLPWLGYFDRIAASDVHIVLDHVQFEKNSFVNRNRIRTPQGSAWLSVPLATSGRFGDLAIADLEAADGGRWRRKHWQAIRTSYGKAAHFAMHAEPLRSLYEGEAGDPRFLPFVERLTAWHLDVLGIETPLVRASTLSPSRTKSALVLELCQAAGATRYLSGPFGRDYLEREAFAAAGIEVVFHDHRPQPYAQRHGEFVSHLAALDALLNLPPDEVRAVMYAGRRLAPD